MATLFVHKRSKFWYVRYRDPQTHKQRRESTGFLRDNPIDTRKARARAATLTAAELAVPAPSTHTSQWDGWVSDFLQVAYQQKRATLERYLTGWTTLKMFLEEKQISHPALLRREHCFAYMTWRAQPDRKRGKLRAGHNTALLELRILRVLLQEAVQRGYCTGNPCVRLQIAKQPVALKPALTPKQITLIREHIAALPAARREFYELSFEIACYQGCRLNETSLNPQTDVVLSRKGNRIRFHAKGGREFWTLLHPKLVPLFQRLRAERRTHTWRAPDHSLRQWAAIKWAHFLRDTGLKEKIPRLCFHSTRVTVVTELYRNNVPENKAQNYVGHASTTTHRIYQRGTPEDLADCVAAVTH